MSDDMKTNQAVILDDAARKRVSQRQKAIFDSELTCGERAGKYSLLIVDILNGDYSTPAPTPQLDYCKLRQELICLHDDYSEGSMTKDSYVIQLDLIITEFGRIPAPTGHENPAFLDGEEYATAEFAKQFHCLLDGSDSSGDYGVPELQRLKERIVTLLKTPPTPLMGIDTKEWWRKINDVYFVGGHNENNPHKYRKVFADLLTAIEEARGWWRRHVVVDCNGHGDVKQFWCVFDTVKLRAVTYGSEDLLFYNTEELAQTKADELNGVGVKEKGWTTRVRWDGMHNLYTPNKDVAGQVQEWAAKDILDLINKQEG